LVLLGKEKFGNNSHPIEFSIKDLSGTWNVFASGGALRLPLEYGYN